MSVYLSINIMVYYSRHFYTLMSLYLWISSPYKNIHRHVTIRSGNDREKDLRSTLPLFLFLQDLDVDLHSVSPLPKRHNPNLFHDYSVHNNGRTHLETDKGRAATPASEESPPRFLWQPPTVSKISLRYLASYGLPMTTFTTSKCESLLQVKV